MVNSMNKAQPCPSPSDLRRLYVLPTVGVVEDVEDVLPLVMPDDVDDGGSVQRSDKERECYLVVRRRGAVAVTSAQRLVDGRRGADDRKLERVGELGDDVGRRT